MYNQIEKQCHAVDLKKTEDLNPDEQIFLIKFLYQITCNDLFLISMKNITPKDKENFIRMHKEILTELNEFKLNLKEFQWLIGEFALFLKLYQHQFNIRLSTILENMRNKKVWTLFIKNLPNHLDFEINNKIEPLKFSSNSESQQTQHRKRKKASQNKSFLFRDLYTLHQYNQNLESLLKVLKIAKELQNVWYYYCIPIPVYWNGFAKGKAIENALNSLTDQEKLTFNLHDTNPPKAQQIKKILASPRWVWEFKIEEDASKNLTNSIKKFF